MSENIDKERAVINVASDYIKKILHSKSQLLNKALDIGSNYIESKISDLSKENNKFEKNNSYTERLMKNSSNQERSI